MPEEKELTIEEMRALIQVTTLLPKLTDVIDKINKDIHELKDSFEGIKSKFRDNALVVQSYQDKVDGFIENQEQHNKKTIGLLESIVKMLTALPDLSSSTAEKTVDNTKKEKDAKKKDKNSEEKEKVKEIAERILSSRGGQRDGRQLTIRDIKDGFHADDVLAAAVIQYLTDKGYYNKETRWLTYPKKKK